MSDEKHPDFIPAGEDTGAITKDGFSDFVPGVEPLVWPPKAEEETPAEPATEEPATRDAKGHFVKK